MLEGKEWSKLLTIDKSLSAFLYYYCNFHIDLIIYWTKLLSSLSLSYLKREKLVQTKSLQQQWSCCLLLLHEGSSDVLTRYIYNDNKEVIWWGLVLRVWSKIYQAKSLATDMGQCPSYVLRKLLHTGNSCPVWS